ncbi:MAG: flagellar motor protein MotB [Rhodospirillales bacterium]|nr:flagellar motor protein MotB [Rhodospirillales bacterium]
MVARPVRHSTTEVDLTGLNPTESNGSGRMWLITFTDLVSLMLTFFVMLFAMSNVKLDEWKNISDSLSQTLRPTPEQQVKKVSATFNIGTIFRKQATDIDYLSSILKENVSKTEGLSGTRVQLFEDRLVISLPGNLLFEPGNAVMTEAAQNALFILGGVFQNIDNQIGVNGHTDATPPVGGLYTSNWELSTARAAAVANTLRQVGYRDKIVAMGFADSKFRKAIPVVAPAGRTMGHRIDIVVSPTVRTDG